MWFNGVVLVKPPYTSNMKKQKDICETFFQIIFITLPIEK